MPSVLLSRASGNPFPLASGNIWSGQGAFHPVGKVVLKLSPDASGFAYISLSGYIPVTSGGPTINSGGFLLSGLNVDGFLMKPGDTYEIPKLALQSGTMNIYATCDAAVSGQGRLYWEAF